MEVILFQPQIPQNTGNIVRTCAIVGAKLVLVKPLGFSLASRYLKRAGLDYWENVDIEVIDNLSTYLCEENRSFYFFSSKAVKNYVDISFGKEDILIFGSETSGLDPQFFERWPEKFITLPQKSGVRCLNLSNAVAISLYEAWRQQGFTPS